MIEFVQDRRRPAPPVVAATHAPRWPTWCGMLLLALVCYLPAALRADLLQFDDPFYFGPDNAVMQAGPWAVLTQPIANAWLPIAHLSLWLDLAWQGNAPFWPHLHAILLHALAAVVLVRLLLQLGVTAWPAHLVGALFVAHPALAESVAWVSGRKDVLCGLFVFLALFQTVQCMRRPGFGRALLLVLWAALAMGSKATAVVLPLFAVLVVLVAGGGRARWLPPLLLTAIVAPLALVHQSIAAAEGTLVAGSLAERLPQAPGAFWHYLGTAVWPNGLNVLYPEVQTLERFTAGWRTGAVALAGVLLLAALAWRSPRTRVAGFGLAAFVVALLPFNTAWPASSIAAADRYLYLAVPWLALAVAGLLACLPRSARPWFAGALLLPFAWLCGSRAHDFADDETLWQASLAVDEDNAVAHLNLVYARMRPGRNVVAMDELEGHLRAAVRAARYPVHELRAQDLLRQVALAQADHGGAMIAAEAAVAAAAAQLECEQSEVRRVAARALLLRAHLDAFLPCREAGDEAAAERHLVALRELGPDQPDVVAFEAMHELAGRREEMLARAAAGGEPRLADDDPRGLEVDRRLGAVRTTHPRHALAWLAQAEWDHARERTLPALRGYRKVQELEPRLVEGWLGAVRLLRETGALTESAEHARRGLASGCQDPRLRQELAFTLVADNRFDEAELQMEAYLRVRPEDEAGKRILANLLVGRAYARLADPQQRPVVRQLVDRALELNPNEVKAQLVLGRLLREQRHFADAIDHLEAAVAAMPDFEDARQQLAECLAGHGYDRLLHRDEDGALLAFRRCVAIAPADFDLGGIRTQLRVAWQRAESRGVERMGEGDLVGAIDQFRRCLEIDPDQHWGAWLLATALSRQPDADREEIVRLCERAVAWQRQHELDEGPQVYLLAATLRQLGRQAEARELAATYLAKPAPEAAPAVLAALRSFAGD